MDFKIDRMGELQLDKNDIKTITDDDERFQQAFCRVQSITPNWFNETTVGANLEQLIGNEINEVLISNGKELITKALTIDNIYKSPEIYIDHTIQDNIVEFIIYLKNSDNLTSRKFSVILDLVAGVNVRLGVD